MRENDKRRYEKIIDIPLGTKIAIVLNNLKTQLCDDYWENDNHNFDLYCEIFDFAEYRDKTSIIAIKKKPSPYRNINNFLKGKSDCEIFDYISNVLEFAIENNIDVLLSKEISKEDVKRVFDIVKVYSNDTFQSILEFELSRGDDFAYNRGDCLEELIEFFLAKNV